ncbi:GTP-binding protein gtr2 [Exophiala oligosperma]
MNHTAVENNITQYEHEMEYAHEQELTVPVVLGETNSDSANLNMSQVEEVLGSALWLIDHLMMGMTMNITRYNLIQGTMFGYAAWVPVPTKGREPYVRAPLYGQIFVADALGHHPNVQIKAAVDKSFPWNMSAYTIYEGGRLAKYAAINFDKWNKTSNFSRPSQEVVLSVSNGETRVRVDRLTGDGASADDGIAGRVSSGTYKPEWLKVGQDGKAKLNIFSTEAVLVTLNGTAPQM